MIRPKATIRYAPVPPEFSGRWDGPVWSMAGVLEIGHFRPESSSHRPRTQAKLLHDSRRVYGIFRVEDRYVRSVTTECQGPVWRDSCVEFFVQPRMDAGYFNFEMNCGGTLLCHYKRVPDPGSPEGSSRVVLLPSECAQVTIFHSLPSIVEPETGTFVTWYIEFSFPFALLETHVGQLGNPSGTVWRGNLYKCADGTSHPHWASWSPVDELNFHLPRCFGDLVFE
jgi:hypothetical protein